MWAQSWENIYDKVAPYTDVELVDLSTTLEEKVCNIKILKQKYNSYILLL